MKKILISFIVFLSLVFLWKNSGSCGWGPWAEDYRVYLFDPKTSNTPDLSPYFFSTNFLNDYSFTDWNNVPEENLIEWSTYFDKKIDKNSISELVYNTSLEQLTKLQKREDTWSDSVYDNKLATYLKEKNKQEVIDYLVYAKKNEIILGAGDPWYGDKYDIVRMKEQVKIGIAKLKNLKDKMLSIRYSYQIVVLYRYMKEYNEAILFYNKNLKSYEIKNKNVIVYWALSHVAACQEKTGKTQESQLNFIKVFANCHAKKFTAFQQIIVPYLDSIKPKMSKDDKYYYRLFREFRNPGKSLDGLKEIALIDPNSEMFNTLIIREVNKIEDWILTRKYTGLEPSIFFWTEGEQDKANVLKSDVEYLNKYITFLEQTLSTQKITDTGLWNLILAHLYFIAENSDKSIQNLEKASNYNLTHQQQIQLRYTRILLRLINTPNYDDKFEELIWKDMEWLIVDKKYSVKDERAFSNLMLAIQKSYHEKKMYSKAALFMTYDISSHEQWTTRWWDFYDPFFYLDKYASAEQVQSFVNTYYSNDKSILEKFLLDHYTLDKNRYLDLMGTIALRNDELKKSLDFYKQIPELFWYENYDYKTYTKNNPFAQIIPFTTKTKDDSLFVNKAYFVKELINLKSKFESAKGVKKSEIATQLGNAYFNMSYFGKNWYYVCYGKSCTGESFGYADFNSEVNENYKKCTIAINYYQKAFEFANNDKEKAKITFTLASTQNNIYYFGDENQVKSNIYAADLKTKFPKDYEFYLDVCPGLKFF